MALDECILTPTHLAHVVIEPTARLLDQTPELLVFQRLRDRRCHQSKRGERSPVGIPLDDRRPPVAVCVAENGDDHRVKSCPNLDVSACAAKLVLDEL